MAPLQVLRQRVTEHLRREALDGLGAVLARHLDGDLVVVVEVDAAAALRLVLRREEVLLQSLVRAHVSIKPELVLAAAAAAAAEVPAAAAPEVPSVAAVPDVQGPPGLEGEPAADPGGPPVNCSLVREASDSGAPGSSTTTSAQVEPGEAKAAQVVETDYRALYCRLVKRIYIN